ncbi:MAG TPA: UDP-N-acetylmuramoyl-L-alanine--D-glutamate ligase [Alphaproteobacteria bacterium]|nr:UDP-N-acetylmuramoyl-L-alanine--D-glutamate ligase [Alphaproteobacteria bacterium]
MIIPHHYKDKRVAVLGLGRSGKSVSQSLLKAGAQVFAWDDQEGAREAARDQGIPIVNLHSLDWEEVDHLILSPGIPHHYPAPHPVVAFAQIGGLRPLSDIELLCQSQPQARYIGITGTNGKSTTTTLIGHILKESGASVEVGGNLGIPVMELNPLKEEAIYVLEVSSYQLEISPSLHFNVGILLNITPDHLERHGGMDGYIAAKRLIYRNSTSQDILVISVDDLPCLTIYDALKASGKVKLLPISTCKVLADGIYVKEGILYENSQSILNLKDFSRLKGQHNWQNVVAAYAALRSMGFEKETIAQGISSFPGLAHRQQEVVHYKNVTFVNDSKATNAEATAKALACYQGSPVYCLLGGRPKEGGITSLKPYFPTIEHAFLYGEAASNFLLTLEGGVPCTVCETLKEATQKAAKLAFDDQKQDAVVLLSPACASFDQFAHFEERGQAFCQYVQGLIAIEEEKVKF